MGKSANYINDFTNWLNAFSLDTVRDTTKPQLHSNKSTYFLYRDLILECMMREKA